MRPYVGDWLGIRGKKNRGRGKYPIQKDKEQRKRGVAHTSAVVPEEEKNRGRGEYPIQKDKEQGKRGVAGSSVVVHQRKKRTGEERSSPYVCS